MPQIFDAVLVLSFGGPERREDVVPFLENVLRGRNVPRERLLQVAEHYYHFDGRSPINAQNRTLVAALKAELAAAGLALPVYWGNRNWQPYLEDTLREMKEAGVTRALAFVTSAFGSYSGCRQYLEDIERARVAVPDAPLVEKLPAFCDHPGFIETMSEYTGRALEAVPAAQREKAELVFTAHSIPVSMAASSPYVAQLLRACDRVAAAVAHREWTLAYQSRSGPPNQPWLEPDILDKLRELAARGVADVVVAPIGFISDHMEVLYDLDTEAKALAAELGLRLIRASTPGTHPRFVKMIRELIEDRLAGRGVEASARQPQCGSPECCAPPSRGRPA